MSTPAMVHRDQLATAARAVSGVRFLALYGSRARGEASSRSDWDFGYLADETMDAAGLLATLVECVGSDHVDVVDLSRASGLLRYRVARDGQLIHEAKPGQFAAFQAEAVGFWCDVEPVLRRGYEDVLAGLSS